MKRLFKQMIAVATVVAVLLSFGTVAFASEEMDYMVFAGYDVSAATEASYYDNASGLWIDRAEDVYKIYNEVVNGRYTNKRVAEEVDPLDTEWLFVGYEAVYPYAGYDQLFVEGNKVPLTRYNSDKFPQWETRRRDFMWQLKAEPSSWGTGVLRGNVTTFGENTANTTDAAGNIISTTQGIMGFPIWERQQTKVFGTTWQWDYGNATFGIPDAAVYQRTSRLAVVTDKHYESYGFGPYRNDGTALSANEVAMYNNFFVTNNNLIDPTTGTTPRDPIAEWFAVLPILQNVTIMSQVDAAGRYVMDEDAIADLLKYVGVESKFVTAKFNDYNDEGLIEKNYVQQYLNPANAGWAWDSDQTDGKTLYDATGRYRDDWLDSAVLMYGTPTVTWTEPFYEMDEPYDQYQYMIINGIVFDGSSAARPRIVRMTHGIASPNVEWRFAFYQLPTIPDSWDQPPILEVVEQKFVDGVAARDDQGNLIYRIPTGEYGKSYYVFYDDGKFVDWRVQDSKGEHDLWLATYDNYGTLVSAMNNFAPAFLHIGGPGSLGVTNTPPTSTPIATTLRLPGVQWLPLPDPDSNVNPPVVLN